MLQQLLSPKTEPVKNNSLVDQEQQTTAPEVNIQPSVVIPKTEKKRNNRKKKILRF